MIAIDNLKILYVEDDPFAQEEMLHFLKKRVKKVFLAGDGKAGLEQFALHSPDIVIVDLLMPKMDGMTMIKELKQLKQDVHIIVLTSVNAVDAILETVDLGIDHYIVKPLDFAELELKLQKISDTIQMENGKFRGVLDELEHKRSLEDEIKRKFVKLLKEYTGKGPRETLVQMMDREITITSFEALTVMEENLLQKNKNYELVKQTRVVAYDSMAGDIEQLVANQIGIEVQYDKAVIDLKKRVEQVKLHV